MPHSKQQSLSRHLLLACRHPTEMHCLLICGWRACFKGKLKQMAGRNSLGRAKHKCCVLMVGQSGSQGHHCPPHTGTGVNHTITATLRSHTNAPHHGTLSWPRQPGLIWKGLVEGEGKHRKRTDRHTPKSTERAVVR